MIGQTDVDDFDDWRGKIVSSGDDVKNASLIVRRSSHTTSETSNGKNVMKLARRRDVNAIESNI